MDIQKDSWDGAPEKSTLTPKKRLLGLGLSNQDGVKKQNHQSEWYNFPSHPPCQNQQRQWRGWYRYL